MEAKPYEKLLRTRLHNHPKHEKVPGLRSPTHILDNHVENSQIVDVVFGNTTHGEMTLIILFLTSI
jgi:hypothetical protein